MDFWLVKLHEMTDTMSFIFTKKKKKLVKDDVNKSVMRH